MTVRRGIFRICYPSGQTFVLAGVLRMVALPAGDDHGEFPGVVTDDGQLMALDPRAVVMQDGHVVVDPRRVQADRCYRWVRDWLREHPEWPAVVLDEAGG